MQAAPPGVMVQAIPRWPVKRLAGQKKLCLQGATETNRRQRIPLRRTRRQRRKHQSHSHQREGHVPKLLWNCPKYPQKILKIWTWLTCLEFFGGSRHETIAELANVFLKGLDSQGPQGDRHSASTLPNDVRSELTGYLT